MWEASSYRQVGRSVYVSIPSLCPCVLPCRQMTCRGVCPFSEKPTLFTPPKSRPGCFKCRLQAQKRTRDYHPLGEERSENGLPKTPRVPSQLAWL